MDPKSLGQCWAHRQIPCEYLLTRKMDGSLRATCALKTSKTVRAILLGLEETWRLTFIDEKNFLRENSMTDGGSRWTTSEANPRLRLNHEFLDALWQWIAQVWDDSLPGGKSSVSSIHKNQKDEAYSTWLFIHSFSSWTKYLMSPKHVASAVLTLREAVKPVPALKDLII